MLKKKAKRRTSLGEKAITLIALVVTIVILLILAAVTITMTLGENGLFQRSKAAKDATIKAMSDEEVELAVSNLKMETTIRKLTQEGSRKFLEDDLKKSDKDTTVTINGNDLKVKHRGNNYNVDQDCNITDEGDFDAAEWDKTATPENVFVWKSDDPNDEGYNTIVGYNATVQNYPILRYPSRCKIIEEDSYETYYKSDFEKGEHGDSYVSLIRSYTSNIKKKEFPETITKISGENFHYNNLESIKLPNKLKEIGECAFRDCRALKSIIIPASVNTIASTAFLECNNLTRIYISKPKGTIQNAPWYAVNAKIEWNYGKEYMTIIIMTSVGTYMRGFRNEKTESIRLPKSLKILDDGFLRRFYNLKNIYIYKDIEYIGDYALSSSITTIRMQGKAGSIIGAPWGADNATVNWNCDSEQ